METRVYILKKTRSQTKGLSRERTSRNPKFRFWNFLFPRTYLKASGSIGDDIWMIEQPMSKFSLIWRRAMMKIFNFKIGRVLVLTNPNHDPEIRRYE
jgi:hypothetical protein